MVGELLGELRSHACRLEGAQELSVLTNAGGKVEQEDVLKDDHVTFEAMDLADVRDLSRTISLAADLDN